MDGRLNVLKILGGKWVEKVIVCVMIASDTIEVFGTDDGHMDGRGRRVASWWVKCEAEMDGEVDLRGDGI